MATNKFIRPVVSKKATVTSTASTVSFSIPEGGSALSIAFHHLSGASPAYFRFDGTTAVVEADNNMVIAPGASREINVEGSSGTCNVSIISAANATVHIEVFY